MCTPRGAGSMQHPPNPPTPPKTPEPLFSFFLFLLKPLTHIFPRHCTVTPLRSARPHLDGVDGDEPVIRVLHKGFEAERGEAGPQQLMHGPVPGGVERRGEDQGACPAYEVVGNVRSFGHLHPGRPGGGSLGSGRFFSQHAGFFGNLFPTGINKKHF